MPAEVPASAAEAPAAPPALDLYAALPAALLALVAGLAIAAWVFGRGGARGPTAPSSAAAESAAAAADKRARRRRRGLARAFVVARAAAARHVLFSADAGGAAAPFVALFGALGEALEVVDLSRVAGGREIAAELRRWRVASPEGSAAVGKDGSEGEGEESEAEARQAFLFVAGALRGDLARVRRQLLARELEAAIPSGRWERVRLDARSARGFDVRSATNAFARLGEAAAEADPRSRVEARPLRSLAELRDADLSALAGCAVPLAARSRRQARRSKLLVCHDMKGGYLSDRFLQGSGDFDAYRFYQWDLVDVFVYFGHALVTIPPAGWVVASHRHGARALGTFIVEGDGGRRLAAELFADARAAEMYADRLAAVARLGGFDGWLVNVETTVPPALVPNVHAFLRALRRGLRADNPDAQVVWYACLASDGALARQVRLDEASADVFRLVDGLYTDYGWTADDAKFSAAFDLDRRYDVFMGVDVFGRHGTAGGGKLHCDALLRLAWNSGVSAALFAPGWTHECYQHEARLPFVAAEDAFWQRVRTAWKPRSPCFDALGGANCFYSTFNAGRGRGGWVCGERVSNAEWSNMGEMDVQPASALHFGVRVATSVGHLTAAIAHSAAFHGGSSVMLAGELARREKKYVKLFSVDIEFAARRITEISYVAAASASSTCLLALTVCPGVDHATHQIILSSGAAGSDPKAAAADLGLSPVLGLRPGRHFLAPVSTEVFAGPTPTGWVRKTYRVGGQLWDGKHLVEIGVLCTASASTQQPGDGGGRDLTADYEAYVGEVCVVGCEKGVPRSVPRSARDEPCACVNARVTSVARLEGPGEVAFGVAWELSTDGEPVRYVLVSLRVPNDQSGSPARRTFMGKSFGQFFWVERCRLARLADREPPSGSLAPPIVGTVELQSVSWAGQLSATVCRLHLEA